MGATPDQVLSIAVLIAFHDLWLRHPGTHEVRPTDDEVLSALPQIALKAFAADMRDNGFGDSVNAHSVDGELTEPDGRSTPITVRDVFNKIIHGTPSQVDVLDASIWLTFTNLRPTRKDNWTKARYSGTSMLHVLRQHAMNVDEERRAVERANEVLEDLRKLGEDRFLPRRSIAPRGEG